MRSNFSYRQFVKEVIDNSTVPVSARGMLREATALGAPDAGDELRKKLIQACEILASSKYYKRTRDNNVKGYLYEGVLLMIDEQPLYSVLRDK